MFRFEVNDPHGLINKAVVNKISDGLYWVNITTEDKWLRVSFNPEEFCYIVNFCREADEFQIRNDYATIKIFHDLNKAGHPVVRGDVDLEYGAAFVLFQMLSTNRIETTYEKPKEKN